jgi:DNA-binding LacI/PurR family transcriptional regulator
VRVSIKDVARAAGVSHSTVSRALNDSSLVNTRTKKRIQRLARQMGYSPNALARSLVTRHSSTVGVVVTMITDPFMSEVVQGIQQTADENGYTVILCSSEEDPQREMAAVSLLRDKRVDAVICVASRIGGLYLDRQEEIGVPVVIINNHNEQVSQYPFTVTVDNEHGGYLAGRHLLQECEHRRVAYVTGPMASTHSSSRDRLNGFRRAYRDLGRDATDLLVFPGNGCPDGGERALVEMMKVTDPPTAVFCYNDMTAMGVMSAARQMGMQIPDDLAVVGFDDILLSTYLNPPLTTVSQPKMAMGEQAMALALSLIREGNWLTASGEDVERALVQCSLVARQSSGLRAAHRMKGSGGA